MPAKYLRLNSHQIPSLLGHRLIYFPTTKLHHLYHYMHNTPIYLTNDIWPQTMVDFMRIWQVKQTVGGNRHRFCKLNCLQQWELTRELRYILPNFGVRCEEKEQQRPPSSQLDLLPSCHRKLSGLISAQQKPFSSPTHLPSKTHVCIHIDMQQYIKCTITCKEWTTYTDKAVHQQVLQMGVEQRVQHVFFISPTLVISVCVHVCGCSTQSNSVWSMIYYCTDTFPVPSIFFF